jgi:hypothetical protein
MSRNAIIVLIYHRQELLDPIFIERYLSESLFADVILCSAAFSLIAVWVVSLTCK